MVNLRDRIGFDADDMRLEDALAWAVAHDFHYVDFNADKLPNRLDAWSDARLQAVREQCTRHAIQLGLHTLSAVNMAEFSPCMTEAVDAYVRAYVDLAERLGCAWMIVHAGYHLSNNIEGRKAASIEHLQRAVSYAEGTGVRLVLENMNLEPNDAELHYLGHTVEECRPYFEAIPSAQLGWAFNVGHAHLVPEGIGGFLDAFGLARLGEVRLVDNRGVKEEHLKPGEGNIDFASLFERLESSGYQHHYTMDFGTLTDLLEGREFFETLIK